MNRKRPLSSSSQNYSPPRKRPRTDDERPGILSTVSTVLKNGFSLFRNYSNHNNNNHNKNDDSMNQQSQNMLYLQRFAKGHKALEGDGGIVLHDGTYSVHKFVHDIEPIYKVVPVTMVPKDTALEEKVGMIQIETDAWDGWVPIMHATRSNVRFYDCYLDPDKNDSPQITCNNGAMVNYNYTKYYDEYIKVRDGQNGKGGCRLEKHKFAHIETPLDREGDSGVFIMGKLIDEKNKNGKKNGEQLLCLTAFIIARGQTLYVPGGTFHTNDYQRGRWRTYLEMDADIDLYDFVKKEKNNKREHILLTFYCGLTEKRMREYDLNAYSVDEKSHKDEKKYSEDKPKVLDFKKNNDSDCKHLSFQFGFK